MRVGPGFFWLVSTCFVLVAGLGLELRFGDYAALQLPPGWLVVWRLAGTWCALLIYIAVALLSDGSAFPLQLIVCVIAAYLGSIFVFSQGHYFVSHFYPGSFNKTLSFITALYFSVTTMATVGFGDIFPKATIAQALVSVQILFSLTFNVVVFAMLAGRLTNLTVRVDRDPKGTKPRHQGRDHQGDGRENSPSYNHALTVPGYGQLSQQVSTILAANANAATNTA